MSEINAIKQWLAIFMAVFALMLAPPVAALAESALDSDTQAQEEPQVLPAAPAIMPVPPLNIALVQNNRIAGNLMVDLMLDISSNEGIEKVSTSQTRLATGYVEALGKWAAAFQDISAPANVIAIKNQLQKVTNDVLGRTDAIVLLQSVMLRRYKSHVMR